MRSVFIVLLILAVGLGGWWLERRRAVRPTRVTANHIPATHPRTQVDSNAASEAGFYIGKGEQRVYINYNTPDPVLRSFMQSVMDGSSDPNAQGREIFSRICAACHQKDGEGKDGVAPPLAGSEWVTNTSGKRMVKIVLNGLAGPIHVRGKEWNMAMPPWRENLDDEQVAVVLTYIRTQLGNRGNAIAPEMVGDARKEQRGKPETADELLRVADP